MAHVPGPPAKMACKALLLLAICGHLRSKVANRRSLSVCVCLSLCSSIFQINQSFLYAIKQMQKTELLRSLLSNKQPLLE